ncbi:MAG: GtrA family protein [Undibacterium sp.]|uniref:GtrA family protein n=1 Tax=Undibacterium sp. TaxID=1914977 RepID=UPI002721A309|nr:GtrA family protein [Undibacterium sp.]MDO8652456.1 GtrA family protein [Undibacterium sp.]
MSAWVGEKGLIGRYLLSGVGNTLVGFGLIFGLMWAGVSAYAANIAGYSLGLVMGFMLSRSFVFNAAGAVSRQMLRYGLAFAACVGLNIVVLAIALEFMQINRFVSQCLAAGSYTAAMYLMNRFYVFENANPKSID